jgi:hypothetical protein
MLKFDRNACGNEDGNPRDNEIAELGRMGPPTTPLDVNFLKSGTDI